MPVLDLPDEAHAVLRSFYTCEFTSVNHRGEPVSWPVVTHYDEADGALVATSSIAFAAKTVNAARHPEVALLYSDPTGCGLLDPPALLVQGHAEVSELLEDRAWVLPLFKTTLRRQPAGAAFVANPLARWLFRFYFQRIAVVIRPRRVTIWPGRDFTRVPTIIDVE